MANTYTELYMQIFFTDQGKENLIAESIRENIEKYMCGIIHRAFMFFSNKAENLGYVILEYTDITNVKNDKQAKYIVYDKHAGYIVNEILHYNSARFECLTPTELSVTKLISQGLSDKEIAAEQGSALDTIKQHKQHIFSKLGINKSTELVALAYDCGLVS